MKKAILTIAAIASVAAANAQHMGQVFVYGSAGFNTAKQENTQGFGGVSLTEESKQRSIFFNPGIGYQINNHWGIGLNVNFQQDKQEEPSFSTTGTDEYRQSTLVVGPFVRYTQHFGEHFFVFGQASVGYLRGDNVTELSTGTGTAKTEFDADGVAVSLAPSVGINITRCFSLIGSFGGLNYINAKVEQKDLPGGATNETKVNNFDFSLGQQFSFGIQFNFGGAMGMHKGHHGMMDDTRNTDTSDDDMDNGKKKKKVRRDDDE